MEKKPQRSPILWILGIFTMIGAMFSAITYLCWAIAPDSMLQSLEIIKDMKMFSAEQVDQILSLYTSISNWEYLLLTIVEVMLFTGAFLMLVKLNKIGFHFYTIGKIVEFCVLNFIIGGMAAMNMNGIITSVLWVLMYATQLRFMNPTDNQDNNTIKQQINPEDNNNSQSHE